MWRDANVWIWVTPHFGFPSVQMLSHRNVFNYKFVTGSFVCCFIKSHATLKAWSAWLLELANAWWHVGARIKPTGLGAMDCCMRAEPKAVLIHSFCRAFFNRTIDLIPQISGCWLSSPSCSTQSSAVGLPWLGRRRTPRLLARPFGQWGFLKTLVVLKKKKKTKNKKVNQKVSMLIIERTANTLK